MAHTGASEAESHGWWLKNEMLLPYTRIYVIRRHATPKTISVSFVVVYKHSLWNLDYSISQYMNLRFDRIHNGLKVPRHEVAQVILALGERLHGSEHNFTWEWA